MDKMNDEARNRISMKDKDNVQEMYDSDSSGQDGSESENEKILKAVNTIIKTSLKRTRGPYKTQNAKRMKVVRDRRQGRQVIDKDVLKPKSRYNASYLVQIMKDFDDDQREYIREIDFGAVLDLDGGVVPWFDNEDMSFHQKTIEINIESFGHVLGVPTTGTPLPAENKLTTMEFLGLFGLSEIPSIKYFGDKIIAKGQTKDEFLRCFMIVALATFYCPTSSTKPSTAYLGGIINVEIIKSYNWGKFFQEWSLWYIKKYQASSSTLALCNYYIAVSTHFLLKCPSHVMFFTFFIIFIFKLLWVFQVRYLDFLDFGTVSIQSTLPRISVWKGEMIKEFIKLDMDDDNYYGKLPVKDILDTCYAQTSLINTIPTDYTTEHLRQSIDSLQHCAFNDKVKGTICSLFEVYTQQETPANCSKVEQLLINVLECLLENHCISSSSQSTEKLNCSSQDKNKSRGSNSVSDNTLKLPSSDTSSNLGRNHGDPDRCVGSQHSNNSVPQVKHQEQHSYIKDKIPLVETNRCQQGETIASTDQIIAKLTEPTMAITVVEKMSDERIHHVNSALCKLHSKESVEPTCVEMHDNKVQMKETTQAEQSFGNSASLEHMLNDEQQALGRDYDAHTSKEQKSVGLNDKRQQEEQIGNAENTPRTKSMQCLQAYRTWENQILS